MAIVRKGDEVQSFLDSNFRGVVEGIEYIPTGDGLMVGGVPPVVAVAHVRCNDGVIRKIKTTDFFIVETGTSRR